MTEGMKCSLSLSQNYFFWTKPKRRVNLRKYREKLARMILAIS